MQIENIMIEGLEFTIYQMINSESSDFYLYHQGAQIINSRKYYELPLVALEYFKKYCTDHLIIARFPRNHSGILDIIDMFDDYDIYYTQFFTETETYFIIPKKGVIND